MSHKKKTRKNPRNVGKTRRSRVWFHEAEDGTRPGLEFLNGMPREPRETLYAILAALRGRAPQTISAAPWSVLEESDTSGIYEAGETHAGTRFRVFCALEPDADGQPALVVLCGDTRPEGKELPASVLRRVRKDAAGYSRAPGRKATTARRNRFDIVLSRELEDPYFRSGFERKLTKIKATNELLRSLERARARKQLTKAEVARRANRRPAAVSRLLAGKDQSPGLDTITDLAYALGLEIELRIRKRRPRSRNAHLP